MADLKTVLTETLRQHGELEDSGGTCECGWYVHGRDHAEHVADVLLGLSGVAVTQLPESDRSWAQHDAWTVDEGFVVAAGNDAVILEDEETVTALKVATANSLAAALLAAAGVFSEGTTND